MIAYKNIFITSCLFLTFIAFSACGKLNKTIANYRGYGEICIHGVKYLQFPSGATVEYDDKGHVVLCPKSTNNN